MPKGFPRVGSPRGSTVRLPTNFTASSTPHTKGGWQLISNPTGPPSVGMILMTDTDVGVAATDTSMLVDIGFGAAGSEVVQVANIPVGGHYRRVQVPIPLYIPAGTVVSGRIQGAVVSDVYDPRITLLYGGRAGAFGGYMIADTIGVNTATSGPTTGDLTDNAWDQAVASTTQMYRALTLHSCQVPADTDMQAGFLILDVGVGAAGVEQLLGSWFISTNGSEQLDGDSPWTLEAEIPAGSRLAIRKNSTNDCSAALIGWA